MSTITDRFSIEGKMVSEKKIIANTFNKYYINTGPILAKEIPNTNMDRNSFQKYSNCNSIFLKNTECDEVEIGIIKCLKIACPGWDGISSKVIGVRCFHISEFLIEPFPMLPLCILHFFFTFFASNL